MRISRHPYRALRLLSVAALAATAMLALPRAAVRAAGGPVDTTVYVCDQSHLLSAIRGAGGGGTIALNKNVTIDGSGQSVAISGGHTPQLAGVRVFSISRGVTVTLNDLTIKDGNAGNDGLGGGIYNDGTLTITNSTISGNSAIANGDAGGIVNMSGATLNITNSTIGGNSASDAGGIDNGGTLNITDSTISGNSATNSGGGIGNIVVGTLNITNSTISDNSAGFADGGIDNGGALNITDSTISGNSAGEGGAIQNDGGGGTLTVDNSTFSGNSATSGGAIQNYGSGAVIVANTILAHSSAGGNCAGSITDKGGNVEDGTSCGFSLATHSLANTDPHLLPLANNGGPTQTMALPAGSPAIGAGLAATCLSTGPTGVDDLDQRGQRRHANTRGTCDSGAFDTGGILSAL